MAETIKLSNKNGAPVLTVGELKELLSPFTDDCPVNKLQVYYVSQEKTGSLEIRLSDYATSSRKLEMIKAEFPQIDPPGIYDERHCCTFILSKDRKRLHEIINN